MSPGERQRKIEEVFLAVADAPTVEREALLARMADGDESVVAEVRSLLGHHKDDGVLEPSREHRRAMLRAVARAEPEVTLGAPIAPGGRIGHYEIKGVLGSGGMGVVYVAEQDRPRRIVALKVIRRGLASRRMLRRFEAEAEMLGRLQHPGIAQIFEAGTWDDGGGAQPYIAMELVDGPALTRWVENKRMGTRDTLALMAKVCDAVHHAHQRGVLHRDLKPGNILVQESVDGIGQPKVLDFGIARPLGDADPSATTLKTDIGQLVGTLAYMSPEQIGGNADEVDVRSDVYALGVIVYRLLSGKLPLDLGERSIPEAARIIMEQAPARLSNVSKVFRGDVETIVLKAMDKDKTRRYQSAAEFAEDLRRYLAGMPIAAKRDSALYVLGKQLNRYRGVAIASAVACVCLLGLGGYSAWQWRVNTVLADQQTLLARSAESARASAEREREESERLRGIADKRTEDLRKQLYSSSIGFAQAALQGDYVRRARELLARCPEDLRGWEWDYLSRLSDTSLTSRRVDREDSKLYLSGVPVNGRIATRTDGQGIRVYKEADLWNGGAPLLEVTEPAAHLPVFAMGGTTIAWSTVDHWTRAFDVDSGKELYRIRPLGGRASVFGVSADGTKLLVGEQAAGRTTLTWVEPRTGAELYRNDLVTPNDLATTFGVSPRGDLIAYALHDGTIGFIDASTFQPIDDRTVKHDRSIARMVFSADGRYLATASAMVSLQITDVDKRQRVSVVTGTQSAFNQIAFSPDGKQVAGAHDDGVLKIYDPMTGRVLSSLRGHTSSVFGVAYSTDGQTIISGGGDGTLRRWDAAPEPDNPVAQMTNWPQCLGVSPDYSVLAVGLANGELRLCDPATGVTQKSMVFTAPPGLKGPWGVSFSRDGRTLAATCGDGSIRIVDVENGTEQRSIGSAHTGRALCSKFNEDGTLLYTTGDDGYVKVWDVATGRSEGMWAAHSGGAFQIHMLPDWKHVVTSGGDGYARLWELATRTKVREFKHSEGEVFSAAVSPDGSRLATGDSTGLLRTWDINTGAMLAESASHDGSIHCIVFSPDGKRLFTGGWDSLARVWDSSSLEQLISLRGHQYMLYHVALTQGGRTLVTSSQDRKIRFWPSRHSDMTRRKALDGGQVEP